MKSLTMPAQQVAPTGVMVENPAFDVTPNKYIAAIITERGIAKAPSRRILKRAGWRGCYYSVR